MDLKSKPGYKPNSLLDKIEKQKQLVFNLKWIAKTETLTEHELEDTLQRLARAKIKLRELQHTLTKIEEWI